MGARRHGQRGTLPLPPLWNVVKCFCAADVVQCLSRRCIYLLFRENVARAMLWTPPGDFRPSDPLTAYPWNKSCGRPWRRLWLYHHSEYPGCAWFFVDVAHFWADVFENFWSLDRTDIADMNGRQSRRRHPNLPPPTRGASRGKRAPTCSERAAYVVNDHVGRVIRKTRERGPQRDEVARER